MKKNLSFALISLSALTFACNSHATPTYANLDYTYEKTEDTATSQNYVTPGYGGQGYDVEYMGLTISEEKLEFAVQSGFDFFKSGAGDLAIDLGNDGTWDYALSFDSDPSPKHVTFYDMSGSTWKSPVHFTQNPEDNSTFYFEVDTEKPFTTVTLDGKFSGKNNSNAQDNYGNSSYVVSGSLHLSLFNNLTNVDQIAISWTMWCGNDVLKVVGDIPKAPVPEPATMLLFGTGLVGLAGIARRRTNR